MFGLRLFFHKSYTDNIPNYLAILLVAISPRRYYTTLWIPHVTLQQALHPYPRDSLVSVIGNIEYTSCFVFIVSNISTSTCLSFITNQFTKNIPTASHNQPQPLSYYYVSALFYVYAWPGLPIIPLPIIYDFCLIEITLVHSPQSLLIVINHPQNHQAKHCFI